MVDLELAIGLLYISLGSVVMPRCALRLYSHVYTCALLKGGPIHLGHDWAAGSVSPGRVA